MDAWLPCQRFPDPELLTKAPAWSYTFPAQQPSNTATSQLIQCTTDRQRLAVIYAASHLYSGDQLEEMLQKCSPPQMVAVDDAYRPELAALLLHATGWLTAKRLGELCRFACVATAGASAAQQLDGLADLVLGPEGVPHHGLSAAHLRLFTVPELRAFCDIKGMAYSEADGEVQLVQAIMQDGRLSLNDIAFHDLGRLKTLAQGEGLPYSSSTSTSKRYHVLSAMLDPQAQRAAPQDLAALDEEGALAKVVAERYTVGELQRVIREAHSEQLLQDAPKQKGPLAEWLVRGGHYTQHVGQMRELCSYAMLPAAGDPEELIGQVRSRVCGSQVNNGLTETRLAALSYWDLWCLARRTHYKPTGYESRQQMAGELIASGQLLAQHLSNTQLRTICRAEDMEVRSHEGDYTMLHWLLKGYDGLRPNVGHAAEAVTHASEVAEHTAEAVAHAAQAAAPGAAAAQEQPDLTPVQLGALSSGQRAALLDAYFAPHIKSDKAKMLQSKGLPAFDCDCLRTWAARLLVAEGFTRSQLESVCCYARVQLQLQGSSDVQLLQALEETVLGRTESEGLSLARLRKLSQPELLAYAVHKRAGGSWQDLAGLGQEQLAQLLLSSGRLRAQDLRLEHLQRLTKGLRLEWTNPHVREKGIQPNRSNRFVHVQALVKARDAVGQKRKH